jgi:hypothetical protein
LESHYKGFPINFENKSGASTIKLFKAAILSVS